MSMNEAPRNGEKRAKRSDPFRRFGILLAWVGALLGFATLFALFWIFLSLGKS
jgi:hypothetical protein